MIHVFTLSAEDTAVDVIIHPLTPLVDNLWTLSLIVDYPSPDDVYVIEPSFAASFFLDRIVKYSKILDTKLKTVFEYIFIPSKSGSFTLGSFTIICPAGITETSPFVLDIRTINENRALSVLRLFWEINPEHSSLRSSTLQSADSFQITAGERTSLVLRTNFPASAGDLPQDFFMPAVPQGAILALSPLSVDEKAAGIMLKLTLIPLKGDFRLNARTLQYDNLIFEIPPLHIRINEFSAESGGEIAYIENTAQKENSKSIIREDYQFSELPVSVNIQNVIAYSTSRKFYIVLFYSVLILVILIPAACLFLLRNEKK